VDDEEHVESILWRAPELCGEVLPGVSRRRIWSTEEKLRILAQSTGPGSSPSLTCRMHGISSGQFYTWRRQFRSGELTGFVPVSAAPEPPSLPAPPPPEPPATAPIGGLVDAPDSPWSLSITLIWSSRQPSAVARPRRAYCRFVLSTFSMTCRIDD
jgi:transposase